MDSPYLDTSALAKWYVNEPLSEAVDKYLGSLSFALISSLTCVELRCLLARRRRQGEITATVVGQIAAQFELDLDNGHLQQVAVRDAHFDRAIHLIDRLPEHPLRTLDALHLSITLAEGVEVLATADRVMAEAAEALGLTVRSFVPSA